MKNNTLSIIAICLSIGTIAGTIGVHKYAKLNDELVVQASERKIDREIEEIIGVLSQGTLPISQFEAGGIRVDIGTSLTHGMSPRRPAIKQLSWKKEAIYYLTV
jgi:pyridoxal biosynthesis lyase PdxS